MNAHLDALIGQANMACRRVAPLANFRIVADAEYARLYTLWHQTGKLALKDKVADAEIRKVAAEALAFFDGLATLQWNEINTIGSAFDGTMRPISDEVRAIFDRRPGLAGWQARREAWAARQDAYVADERVKFAADFTANAPARLLKALRDRGVALGVDAKGHITMRADTVLSADERDAIAKHKAGLVRLLHEESQAARQLMVA